ncbi:MAG TPA: ATP synthase F0 subunit C [Chthoniobacterales bacterium]|jgi:F-type H+-transporting ATPase subunit c
MTTPLFAQAAAVAADQVANLGVTGSLTFGLSAAGAAIGIGLIGGRAAEAVGRNPGAFGRVLTMAIICMALAEAMGIFGLVFLLIGK